MNAPAGTVNAPGPVVIRNPAEATDAPPVPEHPHGRLWRFEMIYSGGALRAYADTPADLVAALIPGYPDLPVTAAAEARLTLACDLQVRLQALLVTAAEDALAGCTPDEQAILLGNFSTPPAVTEWTAAIPLVLITTFYAPYRQAVPTPSGNILWLDPSDNWEFLVCLADAGAIGLHSADSELPPPRDPEEDDDGQR